MVTGPRRANSVPRTARLEWRRFCWAPGWRCAVGLLLALVVALVILSLPTWPYSAAWGYYPSGGLGILLLVALVLLLSRRRV